MEHVIELNLGKGCTMVHPYQYGQFQKFDSGRLMEELLEARIVTPSKRPCSAPIVLVRKRDGSYHLCIDYY